MVMPPAGAGECSDPERKFWGQANCVKSLFYHIHMNNIRQLTLPLLEPEFFPLQTGTTMCQPRRVVEGSND